MTVAKLLMVLNSSKSKETVGRNKAAAAIGSEWEFLLRSQIRD